MRSSLSALRFNASGFALPMLFHSRLAESITLSLRDNRPEIMDQPGLDREKHCGALAGLRRLNLVSGVARQMFKELTTYGRSRGLRSLRVLDIACGGGDVPLAIWKLAQKRGLNLRILGLDVSANACEYAREHCRAAAASIAFDQCDVKRESIPDGFDVVTCSLFLHHLTFDQAAKLLKKMADAGRLLLVNDLRRCAMGYILAQLACRLLATSSVVRYDGPQSVANAFTVSEMRKLCMNAGLLDASIRKAWPCRMIVVRQER
jgi:2-polyprenyl-3-methyl-5-hydroxy-6-metoxy-1,4-benzoquinol methylase